MIRWNNGIGTMIFHVHTPCMLTMPAPHKPGDPFFPAPAEMNGHLSHIIVVVRRQEDQAKLMARDDSGKQMEMFAFGGDTKDETLEALAMQMLERHLPPMTTVFK